MRVTIYVQKLVVLTAFLLCDLVTNAQVNVTTYHNSNARTGSNAAETILTTANVQYSTFGQLFWVPVDGQVYAEPLVLSNLSIAGGAHNVVYVATENDSVYAIDGDTGTIYWQKSLLNGGTPILDNFGGIWNNNVSPQYGITSTPVIDSSTGTIYILASTDQSGVAYHRLHALDVATGAEKFNGPVTINGSYGGQTFDSNVQFNRPALLLQNGHIIVAFGQPCDKCYFGWVFSYNAATLLEEAVFCTNPGTSAGTVWMSGDGVAADPNGNLYFATGNGAFDAVDEFGNSIIRLGLPSGGAFPPSSFDFFSPHNQQFLNDYDLDLGSGGVLVLPDLPSGSHPHLLVGVGKEGTIYLVDRTNLGGWCGSSSCTDKIVQEIQGRGGAPGDPAGNSSNLVGVWGAPTYWNGNVYFGSATKDDPCNYPLQGTCSISDYLKAYSFNAGGSGVLSSVPTSHTPEQFSWPAPNLSVSSNGSTNGILWATDFNNGGSAILRAYDATNLGTEFYTSNSTRDQAGRAVKFSAPTIANGKVYIGEGYANGANGGLEVYGLLSSGPSCTATLACHNYQSAVLAQLTISCTKFANWISTSAEACTPNTNYPNNTLCSGYSSGPTGILTSSSTTAAVPPGNVSGPPNWCNYKYTIGTANYVVNDITAK